MEKILIATDGSQAAEKAIKLGLKWAKAFNSKVYALSVAEVLPIGAELIEVYPKLVEALENKASEAVTSVKSEAEKEGIPCETFVFTSSDPSEVILKKIEELKASLLIIGKKHILGRVSRTIIGKATSPVTVVPAEASLTLEKVLLATDGSVYSQKASLWAIEFCQKLGNTLLVLSVAKTENEVSFAEECVKSAEEKAKNQGVKTESLILKGEPFEKILETSSQKGIDLIVMGCKGKTGIEKILMGSLTERVIEDSKASVVVLK